MLGNWKNFWTFKTGWSGSSITNFITCEVWPLVKVMGTHGLMVNVVHVPLASALLWLKNTLHFGLKSYHLKLSCVHNIIETLLPPQYRNIDNTGPSPAVNHRRIDFVGWFLCVWWLVHSLSLKLVGREDVGQRHYFVPVDWQQVLWNILKQTGSKTRISCDCTFTASYKCHSFKYNGARTIKGL